MQRWSFAIVMPTTEVVFHPSFGILSNTQTRVPKTFAFTFVTSLCNVLQIGTIRFGTKFAASGTIRAPAEKGPLVGVGVDCRKRQGLSHPVRLGVSRRQSYPAHDAGPNGNRPTKMYVPLYD